MEQESSHVQPTGHAEIDRQHRVLEELVERLDDVCMRPRPAACTDSVCDPTHRGECRQRLIQLLRKMLAFMVEHFSYEERQMRQLRPTPENRAHIESHSFAHAELSARLATLTGEANQSDPRRTAAQLRDLVSQWMGGHNRRFDAPLARELGGAEVSEIDLDAELACLLARQAGPR